MKSEVREREREREREKRAPDCKEGGRCHRFLPNDAGGCILCTSSDLGADAWRLIAESGIDAADHKIKAADSFFGVLDKDLTDSNR